jgi:hypothetical protein
MLFTFGRNKSIYLSYVLIVTAPVFFQILILSGGEMTTFIILFV